MICLPLWNLALKKSVVHVDLAAMIAVVHVRPVTAALLLVLVVLQVATLPQQTAATSQWKRSVPITNQPLSAFAKSPRQLQQLTVKENNHVATRSPEIPQRAKGP